MMRIATIPSEQIGSLYFGQLHPYHQHYFGRTWGSHTRIPLRALPHYVFWRDDEYRRAAKSCYYDYLAESWRYYQPNDNSHEKRLEKIAGFVALKEKIEQEGVTTPITVVKLDSGEGVIVDGNHRASIAYHLGIDVPCRYIGQKQAIRGVIHNESEFYGTKRKGRPYQSIIGGTKELIKGRRRDILTRFRKMNISLDIRGKSVADLGCNIGMNAMLAWYFGAKEVKGYEASQRIAASALRLSTLLGQQIGVEIHDLKDPISAQQPFDTVLCFSVHAHVSDKEGLERNIDAVTGGVLYFEGHQRSTRAEYEHIFRHFTDVELIGYNSDGIHRAGSTRPFFRCTR